jgi:hypothetical protein
MARSKLRAHASVLAPLVLALSLGPAAHAGDAPKSSVKDPSSPFYGRSCKLAQHLATPTGLPADCRCLDNRAPTSGIDACKRPYDLAKAKVSVGDGPSFAGYYGAPQTVYSDHFLDTMPVDGPIGFKLEAPPLHPVLAAITLPRHGAAHAGWMHHLPKMQVLLALMRDGFHPASPGGRVTLAGDGTPVLDYPLTPYIWEGVRRAFRTMAEIQFAAGASVVMPIHGNGAAYQDWKRARGAIDGFTLAPLITPVVSAHVMGGCPLGPDPRRAVVDATGCHHQLANLYVLDASLFPTSLGVNPQLTIFALVARLASGLAAKLAPA